MNHFPRDTLWFLSSTFTHNCTVVKLAEACLIREGCAVEGHFNDCMKRIQAHARFRQGPGEAGRRKFEAVFVKHKYISECSAPAEGAKNRLNDARSSPRL